jgi:hypothetical protein
MYGSDSVDRIVEELEYLEAERRELLVNGPHFRILYRIANESVQLNRRQPVAAYLVHAGQSFQVGLGSILVQLFDYMARHNRLAQTARQIESGTHAQRISGVTKSVVSPRRIPRRHVRVYADRIRAVLGPVLRKAGLEIRADAVLVSEETATNETAYRLRGTFEWLHTLE